MILQLLLSPLQKYVLLPGFPFQTDMMFPDFLPQKYGLLLSFPAEKMCCSMASSPETCAVRWLPFEK